MSGIPWKRTSAATAPARALTAAGQRLDLTASTRGKKRAAGQDWQRDAWAYRDAIGEIGYAVRYLRHAVARCIVTPHLSAPGGGPPTPLDQSEERVPPSVLAAATEALGWLTGYTGQWGALLSPQAENFEIAGEAYLVGRDDPDRGEIWETRSMQELEQGSKGWVLKETPGDKGTPLNPASTWIARLWVPHPQYRGLADSPMRGLLEPCEELQLVARHIRGASRSRLAGAGLLMVPNEMEFSVAGQMELAAGAGLLDVLMETMSTAIADEGDASSQVPVMIKANGEHLDKIKHLSLATPVDEKLLNRQEGALRRIGAGLDVPPEIITGMADVNHWSAWAIDASTIRNHVEPLLATMLDAITAAYLRPTLIEMGVPKEWARRVIAWYDVTPLTKKVDRAEDARAGHGAGVLSDAALREALGFDESDAPDDDEVMRRLALTRGTVDAPITEALLALIMSQLDVARAASPQQITVRTGQDIQDVAGEAVALPARAASVPGEPAQPDPAPAPDVDPDDDGTPGAPVISSGQRDLLSQEVTEEGGPVLRAYPRESRRLMDIDRALRDRLTAVADAAMSRALERAGNRARTLANRTPETRELATQHRGSDLVRALIAAGLDEQAGVDVADLVDGVWQDVERAWTSELDAARIDVASTVEQIAPAPVTAAVVPQITDLLDRLSHAAADGLAWLLQQLRADLTQRLTTGDPDRDAVGEAVTPSLGRLSALVRAALALAGGLPGSSGGVRDDGRPADPGVVLGGPGTGTLVAEHLRQLGRDPAGYEWVYGISVRHFEPHRALDGLVVADFDSPLLTNPAGPDGWPGPVLTPGDHAGCMCDLQTTWADSTRTSDVLEAAGAASYDRTYLSVIEAIADGDDRAGRTGTSAQQTRDEARRIADVRPSRRTT